jgi:hypothetical protein
MQKAPGAGGTRGVIAFGPHQPTRTSSGTDGVTPMMRIVCAAAVTLIVLTASAAAALEGGWPRRPPASAFKPIRLYRAPVKAVLLCRRMQARAPFSVLCPQHASTEAVRGLRGQPAASAKPHRSFRRRILLQRTRRAPKRGRVAAARLAQSPLLFLALHNLETLAHASAPERNAPILDRPKARPTERSEGLRARRIGRVLLVESRLVLLAPRW